MLNQLINDKKKFVVLRSDRHKSLSTSSSLISSELALFTKNIDLVLV